jgi:hypothetical protein
MARRRPVERGPVEICPPKPEQLCVYLTGGAGGTGALAGLLVGNGGAGGAGGNATLSTATTVAADTSGATAQISPAITTTAPPTASTGAQKWSTNLLKVFMPQA